MVAVLVLIALFGMTSSSAIMSVQGQRQRDVERELLFIGEQYRRAIESYWMQAPGGIRQWPRRLEDLVEDNRFPKPLRHLRKLYRDPVDPTLSWGLVQVGAGIVGVYSQAAGEPFRITGFPESQRSFEGARRYSDWVFKVELKPSVSPNGKPNVPQPGASPDSRNPSPQSPGLQNPGPQGPGPQFSPSAPRIPEPSPFSSPGSSMSPFGVPRPLR